MWRCLSLLSINALVNVKAYRRLNNIFKQMSSRSSSLLTTDDIFVCHRVALLSCKVGVHRLHICFYPFTAVGKISLLKSDDVLCSPCTCLKALMGHWNRHCVCDYPQLLDVKCILIFLRQTQHAAHSRKKAKGGNPLNCWSGLGSPKMSLPLLWRYHLYLLSSCSLLLKSPRITAPLRETPSFYKKKTVTCKGIKPVFKPYSLPGEYGHQNGGAEELSLVGELICIINLAVVFEI